jgi:hypothetical protein
VLECEQLYVDAQRQWGALHRMSAFHALFPDIILALLNPLLHEFRHQHSIPVPKAVAISWHANIVHLNFFCLSCKCLWTDRFDSSLVTTYTNETKVSSPVTLTMWLRNSLPSLWHRFINVKGKIEAIISGLYAPVIIFGNHLAQNLW